MFTRGMTILRCAALGVALTIAAAGCGGGGPAKTSDGKTTLTVVGWKGGGKEPANIDQINAAFEASHPNIKVQWTYVASGDTYQQSINTQLLGGTAPDVIMVDDTKAKLWSDSGNLLALDGQPWVDTLKPALKDFSKFDGKTVVLPQEIVGVGLYSNMTLLKKAGISAVPRSWGEFTAALDKLKAAGITPIGFANKGGWTGEMAALTLGASEVSATQPGWDAQRRDGTTNFAASQGWMTVLGKIQQLTRYFDVKDALAADPFGKGLTDFESGKSAFLIHGSWNISEFQSKAQFPFQFSAVPGGASADRTAPLMYVGTGLAINAASKAQDAAKEYLAYWAQDSTLQQYLKPEGAITTLAKGTTPPVPESKAFQDAVDRGNGVIYQPQIWRNTKIEDVMKSSLQALLLGQQDRSSVLGDWDKQFAK
jgi:raffinose/stachyose/melibiose transport system substrate-binding protein